MKDQLKRLRSRLVLKYLALVSSLAMSGGLALVKFVWAPWVASGAVETLAEGYGTRMSVGSWTFDLTSLTLTAEDLKVEIPRGSFSRAEVFEADAVELDLSAARLLATRNLAQSIREIVVRDASLHIEERLGGSWNWSGVTDTRLIMEQMGSLTPLLSEPRDSEVDFEIREIRIENGQITWSKEVAGPDIDGLSTESLATLNIDEVTATLRGVRGLVDRRPDASEFALEGRISTGRVAASGAGNLMRWSARSPTDTDSLGRSSGMAWTPSARFRLYLERVSPTTFAALVPDAFLAPIRGRFSADINFSIDEESKLEADGDVLLDGVGFQAVRSEATSSVHDQLEAKLRGYQADGKVRVRTQGSLTDPTYSVVAALQKEAVREGTRDADPLVNQVAAEDLSLQQLLVQGGRELVASQVRDRVSSMISERLSGATGGAIADSLADTVGSGAARALGAVGKTAASALTGGGRTSPSPPAEVGAPSPGTVPGHTPPIQKGAEALGGAAKRAFGGMRRLFGGSDAESEPEQGSR